MKLIIMLSILISTAIIAYAERPKIDREALINQGNSLGADKILDNFTVDNRSQEEAMKLYQIIQEKIRPKADEYAESITFDNVTGVMKFDRRVDKSQSKKDNDTAVAGRYFKDNERLYIFISSSIPKEILKRYVDDVSRLSIGRNAIFVIRGCLDSGRGVGGCGDFKPTLEFIKSIATNKKDSMQNIQLWIDSMLFKKYQIVEVPAFVYVDSVELKYGIGSEGATEMVQTSGYIKSVGDWSLEYHINKLLEGREITSLKNIAKRYMNEKSIQ